MTDELRECDLILKGGAASGAVYPFAVIEIAKKYRLRQIGGSSVGAIATTIAASAEYRRQTGGGMSGFDDIHETAETLARDLGAMFQPYPSVKRLFELVASRMDSKDTVLAAFMRCFRLPIYLTFAAALLLGAVAIWISGPGLALFAMLATALAGCAWIGWLLYIESTRHLRAADFGLCPGLTQPGYGVPGFTNWITDEIDRVAGRTLRADLVPLTIRDLRAHDIRLATMTTDITTQRPYRLPLTEPAFFTRKSEMQHLFPPRVVEYICAPERAMPPQHKDDPADLFQLPVGDDFPVILTARMSLSFPGLITAVPLWRRGTPDPDTPDTPAPMMRLLFSDGGIGSNFPIHFFDAPLPRRITFGIKFAAYDETRHKGERVHLPEMGTTDTDIRSTPQTGMIEFLYALFNTAKDWRDTLQSQLPGYAERIVEIRLDPDQGGLNFMMPQATSEMLQGYGREAGRKLVNAFARQEGAEFDRFDTHRYLRAVSLLSALEEMLEAFHKGFTHKSAGDTPDYPRIMRDLETHLGPMISAKDRRETLLPLMEKLSELGGDLLNAHADAAQDSIREAARLVQKANMRLVATAGAPLSDATERPDA